MGGVDVKGYYQRKCEVSLSCQKSKKKTIAKVYDEAEWIEKWNKSSLAAVKSLANISKNEIQDNTLKALFFNNLL